VDSEYDLFEVLDAGPMWRAHVTGLREACGKLKVLSRGTSNECFAIHVPTKRVVSRLNINSGHGPLLLQIAYDREQAVVRAEMLRLHQYSVVTVLDNESAKVALSVAERCDLFLLGCSAPDETRREMIEWLKANWPAVPVLALNRPGNSLLPEADYNFSLDRGASLSSVIAAALGRHNGGALSADLARANGRHPAKQ